MGAAPVQRSVREPGKNKSSPFWKALVVLTKLRGLIIILKQIAPFNKNLAIKFKLENSFCRFQDISSGSHPFLWKCKKSDEQVSLAAGIPYSRIQRLHPKLSPQDRKVMGAFYEYISKQTTPRFKTMKTRKAVMYHIVLCYFLPSCRTDNGKTKTDL